MNTTIQGFLVSDFVSLFTQDNCPLTQYIAGQRAIDEGLLFHIEGLIRKSTDQNERAGLNELIAFFRINKGTKNRG